MANKKTAIALDDEQVKITLIVEKAEIKTTIEVTKIVTPRLKEVYEVFTDELLGKADKL